ncbi:hypothetical protein [uncultured Maribacter sp.]|uniref:hypothetical protein n=1 Tax=uncultured Maribacter sp. TaxID=431308 RepID=UPI00262FC9F5|nr:hypothetical protein [uncultured Maribacter sp.]
MRKSMKLFSKVSLASIVFSLFLVSCSSDDGSIFETPNNDDTVATLVINQGDPSKDIFTAKANGQVGTKVPGRVIYTSTDITQRRLYITQNISGAGDMPFNDFDLTSSDLKKALKADGSIDLDGATKKEIDFTFDLPVPNIDNGSIVYSFWTTTGKGDFRDPNKRKALGVGTITVTVGTGTNPKAEVHSYTGVKLYAPDVEGRTETFFSLLNETVYKINVGPEFRAFWDFGYYYGVSGASSGELASFSSTATYDANFGFPVEGLKPSATEDADETLNEMFFGLSNFDVTAFDNITLSGDLDVVVKTNSQNITNLEVGDVVEFVDNYGKKGLIKVTAIQAGFGNNDFIEFDVKVQP